MSADTQKLRDATRSFMGWLQRNGLESHDPYDVWGTRYGLWARRQIGRAHV